MVLDATEQQAQQSAGPDDAQQEQRIQDEIRSTSAHLQELEDLTKLLRDVVHQKSA